MGLRGLDGLTSTPFIPFLPLRAGKFTSLGQGPVDRLLSSSRAEPSGRSHGKTAQVSAQLFRPPIFDPRKLTTTFLPGATGTEPQPPAPRRYTLTHNDITGQLNLSIGRNYNTVQVSGWYTRLIRDEVLAEWCLGSDGTVKLHVYCHVSGEERWLAPPALRNYIFQREMPLVLDTILHADRALFQQLRGLADAAVVVHLSSHLTDLNMSVEWGTLSERASWPASERSLLQMVWSSLASRAQPASAAEVRQLVSLTDSITEQLQRTSSAQQLEQSGVIEQLQQNSAGVLSPSGVSREEADASSEPLLIGMDGGSCVTDSLPQRLDNSASAALGSVQQGSANLSAAEDACFSLPAADVKAEGLQMYKSASPDDSWSSGTSLDQEGDSRGSSTAQELRGGGGQQSYRRSGVRGSKGPKTGIILPEGNILEFDHGGSERRPAGMQIATASSSVSEWLASGHEVISVRL